MSWAILIRILLPIIIDLIGKMEDETDCPPGGCDDIIADLQNLQTELDGPQAESIGDLFRCLDWQRIIELVKEAIAIYRDAQDKCGPKL